MPVRSLRSSVLKWPDRQTVDAAVRRLAEREAAGPLRLRALGYFGSYATGSWGAGSDVDLIAVVDQSDLPFEMRAAQWDLSTLPVPADLLVYTTDDWAAMIRRDDRFARMLRRDTVWILGPPAS